MIVYDLYFFPGSVIIESEVIEYNLIKKQRLLKEKKWKLLWSNVNVTF